MRGEFSSLAFQTCTIAVLLLKPLCSCQAANVVWTNLSGGNWNLAGNWSPNQVPTVGDNAFITNSGTYTITLNASATINSLTVGGNTGQQSFANPASTLTLSSSSVVNSNGVFTLSGGTLAGSGLLTVNGLFSWTGGTLGGLTAVTIGTNASLNISGAAAKALDGVLTNAGTITWTGAGYLQFVNNGTTVNGSLYNLAGAVFTAQNDQTIFTSTGLEHINNAGLFRKLGGTGTTVVGVLFTNTGTLDVESGTVSLNNGGTSSGLFTNVAGTTIVQAAGYYTFLAGSQLTGAGTNLWTGGTVTANTTVTTLNVQLAGATLLGTNSFTGTVTWTGGTIGGFASVTIPAAAVLNISGAAAKALDGVLTNAGTITWTGAGYLQLVNNGTTVNGSLYNLAGAVFTAQNDQTIFTSTGLEHINNAGLFRKLVGVGATTFGVLFTNTGTLDVESGKVSFNNGGTSSGLFTNVAGTTIEQASGNYTFLAGSQLTGAGTNLWSGGTVTANTTVTTLNVELAGATLLGTNSFTGMVTWSAGTIGGLANVTIPASTVLNISGAAPKVLDGILTNAGTITWTGAGYLQLVNNGTTVNGTLYNVAGAVFTAQNDQTIFNSTGLEHINNAGLFRKLVGVGTTTFGVLFTNTGTLDVESGKVSFNTGGTSSGLFTNVAGTTIEQASGNYTFLAGSQLTGAGTNLWSGGTVTANTTVTTLNVELAGATLLGTNSFTGMVTWSAGTIGGLANVTIPASTVLNISGAAPKVLDGILTNAGTITWTGAGYLQLVNNGTTVNGTLYNVAGAVFTAQNDQTIFNSTGLEHINNAGLFRKLGSTNTTAIGVNFTNSGTLDAQTGIVSLTSGHSLSRGTLNFGISGLTNFGKINLSGAAALTGTVSANLNNGYVPITNNSFAVLTYGSLTGIFTNTILPAADAWQTNYAAAVFTLLVLNARPMLSTNATQIVDELTTLTVTNTATDPDLPPQTLTFSLAGPTNGMSINPSSGVFTWTPAQTNSPSTNTAAVVVSDNGAPSLSVTNTFTVIVREVNVPPTLPTVLTQIVNELTLLTVTNTATNANIHSTITGYTLVSPPSNMVISASGIITWTPAQTQSPSTNLITTIVTNSNPYDLVNPQLTSTDTFTVIVKEVNVPPTLPAISTQIVNELTLLTVTNTAGNANIHSTITGYTLVSPPSNMVVSAIGIITWTPAQAQSPSTNLITTIVTNSNPYDLVNPQLTSTDTFTVIVKEVNVPPTLPAISTQIVNELTLLTVTNTATNANIHSTITGYTLVSPPSNMIVSASGIISWTPAQAQSPSTNLITTIVTNSNPYDLVNPQLTSTNTFTVIVKEVNVPPTLPAVSTQIVNELTLLSVTNTATNANIHSAITGYTLVSPPSNMVVSAIGIITWTPAQAQSPSTNIITTIVTNSNPYDLVNPQLTSTNTFTVIVKEVNVPPTLPAVSTQIATLLKPFSVTNSATEPNIHSVTGGYLLLDSPAGAAINNSGVITWTPAQNQSLTTNTITTVVTNGNPYDLVNPHLSATNSFSVIVVPNIVGTNIALSNSGGTRLTLNWPADYTGWRLEIQTNAPGQGIGTNWVTFTGSSATNEVVVPIAKTNGSVFFRMIYP